MASYNTVPAAEEPLLQEPIKKSSRKYVVLGAALASFALGALAVTATSPEVTSKMSKFYACATVLGARPDCERHFHKWKHCDWIQSDNAWAGQDLLGHVDSPQECITLVQAKCEKATIAQVWQDGEGDCYCQYGPKSKLKPDGEGWMACHLSDSKI